jgi:hypothetical protein
MVNRRHEIIHAGRYQAFEVAMLPLLSWRPSASVLFISHPALSVKFCSLRWTGKTMGGFAFPGPGTRHALVIELLKFRANPLGPMFEVPEKSHLVFVDLAVREYHSPKPGGFLPIYAAIHQDVEFDGLEEELLEKRTNPFGLVAEGNQELDNTVVDLALGIKFSANEIDIVFVNGAII